MKPEDEKSEGEIDKMSLAELDRYCERRDGKAQRRTRIKVIADSFSIIAASAFGIFLVFEYAFVLPALLSLVIVALAITGLSKIFRNWW
jgi:hypothetical protein